MWNREPSSTSFGSFDRAYWGWKYKDFADATKQQAVKLAVEYACVEGETSTLPSLLAGFVTYCQSIQRSDGSFDQCYPNERTPGVVYDLLPALLYVRGSPFLESALERERLEVVMDRAVAFALGVDETHGEVANHLAEYAHSLLAYAQATGDQRAAKAAQRYLERLLSLFDRDEGWFHEYSGPDPGYQTRTLRYLVRCCLLLDRDELWDVASRAARFVEAVLMPDGSVHPMLGTRSTALLYPSGFELLAVRDRALLPLAQRVRGAWANEKAPLPSCMDFDNALQLADDAWDAWQAARRQPLAKAADPEPGTPAWSFASFPRAGIIVATRSDCRVFLAHRLGGVVIAYGRDSQGAWKLIDEDSGYLARRGDDRWWASRMPGAGVLSEEGPGVWTIRTTFHQALHDELTTLRLIALRLLNLTVLRWQFLGDLFRRIVVRRLMGRRRTGPLELVRVVSLGEERLGVSDQLQERRGSGRGWTLLRCRRIVSTHMASSRYFQASEMLSLPTGWATPVPWTSGTALRVDRSIVLRPLGSRIPVAQASLP